MVKKCLLLIMVLFPMFMMAQNEVSKKQTKYEEFVSKTGSIIKYVEKSMKKCQMDLNYSLKVRMRTVYGEGKNLYFLILEKGKTFTSEPSFAYIEYSDLVEINKALAKLLNEEKSDCELKPEYLQNIFTSEDGFKVGYYVEKSKATWKVKLEYGAEYLPIGKPKEFADYLLVAQKEIEATIAQNGK